MKELFFYGSIDYIKANPPEILIEVFDADLMMVNCLVLIKLE